MSHPNYTYDIPVPQARRFVIPDVHGCAETFKELLTVVGLQKNDQLFLLGDYVDRGPDSKGVIDEILRLSNEGYSVFPLRGNHEQMLLDITFHEDLLNPEVYLDSNCILMLNRKKQLDSAYFDFLTNLPYYFELDTCFLVHAGFNPKAWDPFIDADSMLWIRQFKYDVKLLKGKRIYHGHTPIPYQYIKESLKKDSPVVNLDNGCVFTQNYEGLGNLLCMDIDSGQLYKQPNIDY